MERGDGSSFHFWDAASQKLLRMLVGMPFQTGAASQLLLIEFAGMPFF